MCTCAYVCTYNEKQTLDILSSRHPAALHTALLPVLDLTQAFQVLPMLLFLSAISYFPEYSKHNKVSTCNKVSKTPHSAHQMQRIKQ